MIPLFNNLLSADIFYFIASYVFAIRILYEPHRETDLNIAQEILKNYVMKIQDFFGLNAYDYTVHAHLHLVDQVKQHGPLQCYSQFAFEVL